MIILSANNITKAYGVDEILTNISFHVNEGDRVGIIGANGAGKTTLLKILSGEMKYDSGEYFISAGRTIGYLKQNDNFKSENTVFAEVSGIFLHLQKMEEDMHFMSDEIAEKSKRGENVEKLLLKYDELQTEFENKNGYGYKSEINGILNSMAFTEDFYNKKIETLSGGERTRLALACLLLKKPDMLFLDEPTNHLDIGTLKWLEQYLKSYTGTILLISHDRYFLDQTVNKIFEVENHKLYVYEGNYSTFAEKKRAKREDEWRAYTSQQKEIARQEEIVRRFKERGTEKLAKRAASREKRLDRIDVMDRPDPEVGKMKIRFKQNFKSGNDVLLGENLKKGFGYGQNRKELFSNVNFDIKRGERICIVGANGVGKTTLLKIMMEQLTADGGFLKIGHNVSFGYYDQEQQNLQLNNTVIEELREAYRLYTDTEMRSILGRFLFKGDTVFLGIKALSGGEKARLSLLKLMLSGANILMLDEPTNHLDIDSKEVFEEALLEYPGTVIAISHDRYFLNKIPTKIFELGTDGITNYLGTYNYYVEKKQSIDSGKKYLNQLKNEENSEKNQGIDTELSAACERKRKKEQEADERRTKRKIEELEKDIERLECEIATFEEDMCNEEYFSNHEKLVEWDGMIQIAKQQLAQKYSQWEKIMAETV